MGNQSNSEIQPRGKNLFLQSIKNIGLWFGLTTILILMTGGLSPLYTGTQRYHYIFGQAAAGFGELASDWFATTQNPWILFQYIVQFTAEYLGNPFFYVYQFIMMFIYLFSLVGIVDHFFKIRRDWRVFFIFMSFYLSSYAFYWPDWIGHHIYAGVATMYMPMDVFIPNSFAALLFLSIYLFFKEKYPASILSILVACYVHPSYLIVGAALVTGYMLAMFLDGKKFKQIVLFGGVTFLLVIPLVAYYYSINLKATPEQVKEATNIMAGIVLPHHTHVEVWWTKYDFIKLLIVMGALFVTRKTRLFYIILVGFVFVAVPSIVLAIRPSNTIGALMLWRPAVVVVPLATTSLIAFWVSRGYTDNQADITKYWKWAMAGLTALVLFTMVEGTEFQIEKIDRIQKRRSLPVTLYIKENLQPGDQYLLPIDSLMASSFELDTGAPVVVIWLQHPWGALDTLEWNHRVQVVSEFYAAENGERCELLPGLVDTYGVTHVITHRTDGLNCEGWNLVYKDETQRIYAQVDEQP